MTRALFACGGAKLPADLSGYDTAEVLDWRGEHPTMAIELLEHKLVESFEPLSRDLLELAACVYAADRLVSRGGNNIGGSQWEREMELVLPVREPAKWRAVSPALGRMLGFLTDDVWRFRFVQARRTTARPLPIFEDQRYRNCDCVALFSGGLDSLAGVVADRANSDHRPLLVSHRSYAVIDRRQRDLVARLNSDAPVCQHIQFWVHLRGREDREPSQRSRSFLFLAVAAVLARQFGIGQIHVFENGILSINLPIAPQVVGTMASRTTHPRFISEMHGLYRSLYGSVITIDQPFLLKTKRQIVELLQDAKREALIEFSSSCTHPYWRSALKQHCGICSQCIDRRFAVEAAGLGESDKTYERDIFTEPMSAMPREAEARGLIEGYLRTYREVGEFNEEAFWLRFPELTQLANYLDRETLEQLYPMYRRQWEDLDGVLRAQLASRLGELVRGQLPSDCVLQFILAQALNRKSQARYADRLTELAQRAWRTAFSGRRAADEPEVQRALHVALAGAEEQLEREHPLFLFISGVKAKPDFAEGRRRVWVEVKYPRTGSTSVRQVTEDIGADLLKYRDQAELVLFLIYDPDSLVANREEFSRSLEEKDSHVLVRVV